jgi:hypothetical protein
MSFAHPEQIMKNLVIAFSLTLLSACANAEEMVFGFVMGKRIEAPECPSKTIAGKKYFEVMSSYTCAWNEEHKPNDLFPSRIIVLAKDSAPSFMKGLFRAYLKDGLFIGARFATFGINSQDETFTQLANKYGQPSSINRSQVQNLAGATFEAITAEWRHDNIVVTLNGVTDKIDLGEVRIETDEFFNAKAQQTKQRLKTEIKL